MMNYVSLTGYCPEQKKEFTISAKLFDETVKKIGRVECNYKRYGGNCTQSQCPIVKQNGYRH